MTRLFCLTDINYRIIDTPEGKSTELMLFGKFDDHEHAVLLSRNVKPYFLVDLKDSFDDFQIFCNTLENPEFNIIELKKITKKTFTEEKEYIKVVVNTPKAVPYFRDLFRQRNISVYEADIPFVDRIMYDYNLAMFKWYNVNVKEYNKANFRVNAYITDMSFELHQDAKLDQFRILSFDIENYVKDKDKIFDFDNPIVSIGVYSKLNNEPYYKVFTYREFNNKDKDDFDSDNIVVCRDEADMLDNFRKEIIKLMPDFIVGYNSDGYDFPFIINRSKKYGIDMNFSFDLSSPIKTRDGVFTQGISHIDLYRYIASIMSSSLSTSRYTLQNVAQEILGESKADFDPASIASIWENHDDDGLFDMLYYNYVDTKVTYNLSEVILTELFELTKIVNSPIIKISRSSPIKILEFLLFMTSVNNNFIIPNLPSSYEVDLRKTESAGGGFVKDPIIGKHEDIYVFDFQSLYPSIIVTRNISLETVKCNCCEENKVPDKDIWFCKHKKGFLSSLVASLLERRRVVKNLLKSNDLDQRTRIILKSRSNILKMLSSTIHGYLNFAYARWYSFECADGITACARSLIKKVMVIALSYGLNVIYGDTDSCFLTGDKDKIDKFSEEVNNMLEKPMHLDYQGHYKSGIFTGAKKRYALLDDNDNIIIKGFEFVRRNVSRIAKATQYQAIELMLKEDEETALQFVKDVVHKLKNNIEEFNTRDFAINVRISRELKSYSSNAPHIVLAKRLAETEKVSPGTIISYAVLKRPGNNINERVELIDDVELNDIDVDYYIDNQIIPAVERIFAVFDISGDELKGKSKQTSLSGFFG